MSSIERMMREDIRAMKRIGRNIKHQKGKRGLGTGNSNPLKGMSQREIAKKHGKVKVYDMTRILTHAEFKQLDKDMQKLHMESWRMRFSNSEIIEGMGIAQATFYKTCNKLDIAMNKREKAHRTQKKKQAVRVETMEKVAKVEKIEEEIIVTDTNSTPTPSVPTVEEAVPTTTTSVGQKMLVALDGAYKGVDLHNKLQGLAMFLNDETEYIIKIEIKQ